MSRIPAKLTAQERYRQSMRDQGYVLKQFFLSPEALTALEALMETERLSGQEVIAKALLSLAASGSSGSSAHSLDTPSHDDIQSTNEGDVRMRRIEEKLDRMALAVESLAQERGQKSKGGSSRREGSAQSQALKQFSLVAPSR